MARTRLSAMANIVGNSHRRAAPQNDVPPTSWREWTHMPRSLLVLTLQCALAVAAVARSHPTHTLLWSSPQRSFVGQPVSFYAEVIGDGTSAPQGAVTFKMAGNPIAITPIAAVTNKNYLRHSSQFDKPAWTALDKSSVLTPDYSSSPLDDRTAYRYQNTAETTGTYISQEVSGLPGTQPVTFSLWIKANQGSGQDVEIMIFDPEHHRRVVQPCYLTPNWQRCSVTTPENPTSVTVLMGSDETQWPWDAVIWGAQLEASPLAGAYVRSGDAPSVATFGMATFVAGCCVKSGPYTASYNPDGLQATAEPAPIAARECPDPRMRQATVGGNSIVGTVMQSQKSPRRGKFLNMARVDIYSVYGEEGHIGLTLPHEAFETGLLPATDYGGIYSIPREQSRVIVVFTNESGMFDSGVLPEGSYRIEVSGWGSAIVHLNPEMGKDGFGTFYWVDLLDNGCIGVGASSN